MPPTNLDCFYEEFWHDHEEGELKPVEEYVRRYPDHEAEIREAYERNSQSPSAETEVESAEMAYMAGSSPAEIKEDLTGRVLSGKYRVRRLLGRGGFGTVYEAEDEMLGALVAVKVLNRKAASHEQAIERFLEEAKVLTNLDHPNIVRWITFDKTDNDLHYFVMEYLRGEELSTLLRREGRLEPKRVVEILLQIVSALRAAHRLPDGSSLLHLDLKPQNVFVVKGDPERVKVIDFGISQHVGAEARAARGVLPRLGGNGGGDIDACMTTMAAPLTPLTGETDDAPVATGAVQRARGGTPLYASPEQSKHLAMHSDIITLDQRSDLYSLGIMAFQMLSGELPYGLPSTPIECFKAHIEKTPRKLSGFGVKAPRRLVAFVDRCLEKNREDRFASSDEALEELERIQRPPALWKVAAVVLAAALVVLIWVWPDPERFEIEAGKNDEVYLGPNRRTVELPLTSLEIPGASAVATLVSDPAVGEEVLANWTTVIQRKGGRLEVKLTAPEDGADLVEKTVHLKVEDGDPEYSTGFRLVFLGANSWGIQRVFVPRLQANEVLDPRGAKLFIELSGKRDFFADDGVHVTYENEEDSQSNAVPLVAASVPTDWRV